MSFNRFFPAAVSIAAAVMLCGCFSTPPRHVFPSATPAAVAENHVTSQRIKEFRRITGGFKERGIGIYPEAFEERVQAAEVVKRIEQLGFNRVYCCITTERALNDQLTGLIKLLGEKNIPVEIVLFQRDYYRVFHTNQLLRPLVPGYLSFKEAVEKVIGFNNDLPEEVKKISGVTLVIEPHCFSNSNVERSHGKLYAWEEDRYGIGKDNDMLMRDAFRQLKEISALPGLPSLRIAMHDFFHSKAEKGELSCGKISDFQKFGQVMVINSGNVPTQLVKSVEDELKAAGKSPLLVVIPLAGHISENEGRLRRRDWRDFCRALDYAGKHFKKYPSFHGVVVSPLAVIEFLRQEK